MVAVRNLLILLGVLVALISGALLFADATLQANLAHYDIGLHAEMAQARQVRELGARLASVEAQLLRVNATSTPTTLAQLTRDLAALDESLAHLRRRDAEGALSRRVRGVRSVGARALAGGLVRSSEMDEVRLVKALCEARVVETTASVVRLEALRHDEERLYARVFPLFIALIATLMGLLLSVTFWKIRRVIADHEQAQAKLKRALETTETILGGVPFGIVVTDVHKKIRRINKAALNIIGKREGEVIGRNCHDTICPTPHDECVYWDLGRSIDREEKGVYGHTGELIPVLKTAIPISLEGEEMLLEAFVDITEQKETQAALEVTQAAAEASSLAKSAFLATMSHEIRTPMNGVLGMIDVLQDTVLTEEQRGYLDTLVNSGQALLMLIDDILDFSKIEAGRLELLSVPFDLHREALGVVELMRGTARAKGVELRLAYEPSTRGLLGDPGRLRQVLLNLVSNAIKFTDAGEVEVRIRAAQLPTSADGDLASLRVEVIDSGMGIAQRDQARLFQSFSQVDSSDARRHGGTGLGLAICKQLVELMGGQIGVESVAGGGSTFWFTLTRPRHSASPVIVPTTNTGTLLLEAHVLLVEDNLVNQKVALAMLKRLGITCDVASDGGAALVLLEANSYDMVFMDCQMPGMDGYETTTRLRALEAERDLKHLPVVALTANAQARDRAQCLAVGMNDFLVKPLRRIDLLECLARWLA